jgi:hypothetical protein
LRTISFSVVMFEPRKRVVERRSVAQMSGQENTPPAGPEKGLIFALEKSYDSSREVSEQSRKEV